MKNHNIRNLFAFLFAGIIALFLSSSYGILTETSTSNKDGSRISVAPNKTYYNVTQAAGTTDLLNIYNLANGTVQLTSDYAPQVPRSLFYTVADGAATGLQIAITVTGIDQFGNSQTEVITKTSQTGPLTLEGSVIWLSISNIQLVSSSVAGTDTLSIGWGRRLGLGFDISLSTDINLITKDAANITTSSQEISPIQDYVDPPAGAVTGVYYVWGIPR